MSYISYKETVGGESRKTAMSESPNKHNRIYTKAQPLSNELSGAIEEGKIPSDNEARSRVLVNDFGWDPSTANRIWCLGPSGTGPNLLLDEIKGLRGLSDIKDSIIAAFQSVAKEGVLANEPLRGVRFDLVDVTFTPDTSDRSKSSEIESATRRALYAALLLANPFLLAPIDRVEVTVPENTVGQIYEALNQRRGQVLDARPDSASSNFILSGIVPTSESSGFKDDLKSKTGGQASSEFTQSHWEVVSGDPLNTGSTPGQIVTQIRKRKGLKESVPDVNEFFDEL